MTAPPTVPESGIAAALASILLPLVQAQIDARLGAIDPAKLIAEADALISSKIAALSLPRQLEVKVSDRPAINVGYAHKQFDTLLRTIAARANVALVGPSGSGKTHAVEQAAKALGLPFYFESAVDSAYSLSGFPDATGKVVRTKFRAAYEDGGVFLLDEGDGCDPNATLWLNGALANGVGSFPDRMVPRHPDCVVALAANTYGRGATKDYVGRNKLDEAFLKRFAFLEWAYDSELELASTPNRDWTLHVQMVREWVAQKGLRVLVTPRESFIGAALLSQGIAREQVETMTICAGWSADQVSEMRKSVST